MCDLFSSFLNKVTISGNNKSHSIPGEEVKLRVTHPKYVLYVYLSSLAPYSFIQVQSISFFDVSWTFSGTVLKCSKELYIKYWVWPGKRIERPFLNNVFLKKQSPKWGSCLRFQEVQIQWLARKARTQK